MDVSSDLAQRCAALADGLTLPALLHRNAGTYPDHPALSIFGTEEKLTWRELHDRIAVCSRGLAQLGVGAGDRIILLMPSRLEHWIVDLAAVHLGAIPCTAYSTLSPEQLRYLAEHSAAKVLVVNGEAEWRKVQKMVGELPQLRHVIVVDEDVDAPGATPLSTVIAAGEAAHAADPAAFETTWRKIRPEQPITLLYTSGTTGDPKGVLLSHHNVIYQAVGLGETVPVPDHPRIMAYLPLAHIAERMLGIYNLTYRAAHATVVTDPAQLVAALRATRPNSFFGVPRVWEKMAAGVQAQLANADPAVRQAFEAATALARERYLARSEGRSFPEEKEARFAELDRAVLHPTRALLGLDEAVFAGSGAAPIPVEVLLFLAGLGVEILEVWGMTETTGTATINTKTAFRPGSVGRPHAGMELRLCEDGEIQVRGPLVCLGYLRADGGVDPVVDEEGWLSTGDIGEIDDDGFLKIVDRKKEIIINSSGKNISPAQIENLLRAHPLIGQAVAIGDRRPYVTALIILDEEAAPVWAAAQGVEDRSLPALAVNPAVRAAVAEAVDAVNERLSRPEQIKKFRIMPYAWTPETGELTPTLKLRRRIVAEQHAALIDGMYTENEV